MIIYLLASILVAAAAFVVRGRRTLYAVGALFYAVQLALLTVLCCGAAPQSQAGGLFVFDAPGTLFYGLLTLVSIYAFHHSEAYLKASDIGHLRTYSGLDDAAHDGHRRRLLRRQPRRDVDLPGGHDPLLGGHDLLPPHGPGARGGVEISVRMLDGHRHGLPGHPAAGGRLARRVAGLRRSRRRPAGSQPLYLKIAFLLILTGYSCKMELFPLYTVGVDANFAAPAPASALISTGLVNAGFLAILRVYKLYAATEVFPWVRGVLLAAGVLSLGVGALFLRRTNNYKRFLSYSTVENMGIAAIGLGIGGAGVWAAVFHVVCHTLVKSSLFLQMGVVRQVYDGYRINRLGDYMRINRVGAVGLMAGMVALVAFPPSPLFVSELMILSEAAATERWWLLALLLLLTCIVIYSFCSRMIRLCYQPNQDQLHPSGVDRALSWSALSLLVAALVIGFWQPALLQRIITEIATL